MKICSSSVAPIMKGDRFNLSECLKNDFRTRTHEKHSVCFGGWKLDMLRSVPNLTLHLLLGC